MQEQILLYTQMIVSIVLVSLVGAILRALFKKLEDYIANRLPKDEAQKVNDFIDVIERLTEAAVQDSNSRIVSGLKQHNLFTRETGEAVKQAVIQDVIKNLGPLSEKASMMGPLENIIGHMVEKHVQNTKNQVNQTIANKPDQATPQTGHCARLLLP